MRARLPQKTPPSPSLPRKGGREEHGGTSAGPFGASP